MAKSPEIFDPYVGKVYGNILDQYDNVTYNIKIAVIPGVTAQATAPTSNTGASARQTTNGSTRDPSNIDDNRVDPETGYTNRETAFLNSSAYKTAEELNPLKYSAVYPELPIAGTGTVSENIASLNAYILKTKGISTSENKQITGKTPSGHTGLGHNVYDSAIDVNYGPGTGNGTPASGEKAALDKLAKELKQAKYTVLWQVDDHKDHLHVEIPQARLKHQPLGTTPSTETPTNPIPTEPRVPDSQQVIIAQTGVTGVTVDDLEMEFTTNTEHNYNLGGISFTLKQPGAANLLDQLRVAQAYVGGSATAPPTLLIEISFMGYNSNPDDNTQGGEPVLISGPFSWRTAIGSIVAEVTPAGSEYRFECTMLSSMNGPGSADCYNDLVFRTPKHLTTEGDTISAHVKSLETSLNEYLRQNCTAYTAPDQYKFDLSRLLKSNSSMATSSRIDHRIENEKVSTNNDPSTEKTGVASNDQVPIQDAAEAKENNRTNSKIAGTRTEQLPAGGKLEVSEQTTLTDYFAKLLNMNTEFRSKISALVNIDDPTSKVDPNKLSTAWFTINVDSTRTAYDPKRGDYTKIYTVTPVVYDTIRPDIQRLSIGESADEELGTSELAANAILEKIIAEGKLHKSYQYFFTGLNDQIIDFKISYDGGHTLITAPPRSGFIGDTSVVNAVALNPTLSATAPADILTQIKQTVDLGHNALGLVNYLKNASDQVRQFIATTVGSTEAEIKAILSDTSGKSAAALASRISAIELDKIARSFPAGSGNNPATPTSSNITNLDGTSYSPETSNRVYAEDLVNKAFQGSLTMDQISALGPANMKGKSPDEVFKMQQQINNVNTLAGPGESSTYSDAGIGNILFSYIHQQHANSHFLQTVDLTLRGDPWYLGKGVDSAYSTPDQSVQTGGIQNYFLLTVASPLHFDFNSDNEDKNSGYWNMNGMSQSFSGLYWSTSVINSFNNGVFTTKMTATKNYGIPLYKIRPLKPGEAPENYIRNGKDIRTDLGSYVYGQNKDSANATATATTIGAPGVGTKPSGSMTKAEEDQQWAKLEAQEASARLAAGLPAKFSEAERRAINGILASEGGDPSYTLASMLKRSYENKAPVNDIVFGLHQYSPVDSTLGIFQDSYGSKQGHINGGQNFIGGYNSSATSNLTAAISGYQVPLSKGYTYFLAGETTTNKYGTAPVTVSGPTGPQTYFISKVPGPDPGWTRGTAARQAEFYRLNNIPPPTG